MWDCVDCTTVVGDEFHFVGEYQVSFMFYVYQSNNMRYIYFLYNVGFIIFLCKLSFSPFMLTVTT